MTRKKSVTWTNLLHFNLMTFRKKVSNLDKPITFQSKDF